MGLRFFRRLHIAPGVGINLSRSGPSLSFGVRGAHVTLGPKAITRTIGLPGSGVFYTDRKGYHTGLHSAVPNHSGAVGGFGVGVIVGIALVIIAIIAALAL